MKRWFLAGVAAAGVGALAQAQPPTPGYMIIRVVLDAPPGQLGGGGDGNLRGLRRYPRDGR